MVFASNNCEFRGDWCRICSSWAHNRFSPLWIVFGSCFERFFNLIVPISLVAEKDIYTVGHVSICWLLVLKEFKSCSKIIQALPSNFLTRSRSPFSSSELYSTNKILAWIFANIVLCLNKVGMSAGWTASLVSLTCSIAHAEDK